MRWSAAPSRLLSTGAVAALMALGVGACGSSSSSSKPASSSAANAATTSSTGTSATGIIGQAQAAVDAAYKGTSTTPKLTPAKPKTGVNAWWISCGQASEGCARPAAAAQTAAKAAGWHLNVFDGNFDVGDAYNNGIRQAIAAKANVIIVNGIDCDAIQSSLQQAKSAGIPVIASPASDCNDPLIHSGPALFAGTMIYAAPTPTVPEFNEALGKLKAEWLIAKTNGKAKVILMDLQGLVAAEYITKGFKAEMAKCTTCTIVDDVKFTPQDLTNGIAKSDFASALTGNPTANAVSVPFDSIVIQAGIGQAVVSSGRASQINVIGTEGLSPNVALIRSDRGQNAATPFDEQWIGWAGVDEAIRVLDHQSTVSEGVGYVLMDKTHNLPPVGQSYVTPINYKSAYLKAWGVKSAG